MKTQALQGILKVLKKDKVETCMVNVSDGKYYRIRLDECEMDVTIGILSAETTYDTQVFINIDNITTIAL